MDGVSKVVRSGQIIIGLIYVVAGAIKVWEPVLFYWESIPYTQILGIGRDNWEQATAVAKVATLLGPIEFALGVALLLNWRPQISLPVATVLMAFFTGLMVKAWQMGASIDCGCFGALVERSPGEAAVEDAVMLAVLVFAWWGMRRAAKGEAGEVAANWWGSGGAPALPLANKIVLGTLVAGLAVAGARYFPAADRLAQSDLKSGVRLTGLSLKGTDIDLMEGKYLVELFSPTCGHCMDAVPKINKLHLDPEVPPVVALTAFAQDSPQLAEFVKRLQPSFTIATISQTDYYRLTFGHGYPRLAYVKDGVVQSVWERDFVPGLVRMKEITGP
ncbi:MAG: hypothetical protein QGH25_08260 [Candidatus Latescibacteria bacterium]|jgi:thiol-disulfide isomerase/thioredoxin|nr:hypothetical protein [Candidatus Latescibacterota bacterium]